MRWNMWIRQSHRWLSILFAAIVAGIFITKAMGKEPLNWVYFMPLPPLALLLVTGLYLFVLPYASKGVRRGAQ